MADEGLIVPHRQVRQLGDIASRGAEILQVFLTDGRVPELQLEVRDDRYEVGISTALAVSVHAALHLGAARLDRRDCIRHGNIGVVVCMYSQNSVEALTNL